MGSPFYGNFANNEVFFFLTLSVSKKKWYLVSICISWIISEVQTIFS